MNIIISYMRTFLRIAFMTPLLFLHGQPGFVSGFHGRIIDFHQHISLKDTYYARAARVMNGSGIDFAMNLSGGTVTKTDEPSHLEKSIALANQFAPGKFLHFMNLDYSKWDAADFSELAVQQIETGHKLGAVGLKEFKRLGLYLRDKNGQLIPIDSPKLDPVWRKCGELQMPVAIHVADPRAFWLPYDASNERWKELKDHKNWWFGDPNIFPPRTELLEALDRVIAKHTQTKFICVHFANNAEDLKWVSDKLDTRPNMYADLAARIPELGRHAPEAVRDLFNRHADRIIFASDFQVHDSMILGSSGSGPAPTEEMAMDFFAKSWRWIETSDRQFEHMTPIQGDWKIDAIHLPANLQRKIYFDNARELLVRSLPLPRVQAASIKDDFELSGRLQNPNWKKAKVVLLESMLKTGRTRPELSTRVRVLWSQNHLYIGYESPFESLTYFDPPLSTGERSGLWDKDVVEVFIGGDPTNLRNYTEFEVAPTGESLDLNLGLKSKQLEWNSGFQSRVHVDESSKIWTCEMKIPLTKLSASKPTPTQNWRINFYRHDIHHRSFLAWNPTATPSAHTPDRFGILEFLPF